MVGLPPFDLQVCCNLLLSIESSWKPAQEHMRNRAKLGAWWDDIAEVSVDEGRLPERRSARIKDVDFRTSSVKKNMPPASISTLTGSILHRSPIPATGNQAKCRQVVWRKLSKRQGIVGRGCLGMHSNDWHWFSKYQMRNSKLKKPLRVRQQVLPLQPDKRDRACNLNNFEQSWGVSACNVRVGSKSISSYGKTGGIGCIQSYGGQQ